MKKPLYLDASQDVETRVNDLIKRMTIDEKINQMYTTGMNELEDLYAKATSGENVDISASFVYFGFNPETYNKLQKYQIEHNRLKIPFILACENTHGVSNPLCTIFPTTGCMAATFDDKLIGKCAKTSAKEAKILGISQVYAPNIDISWDLRWGRVEENFGEDPYLTSRMGVALVKNYQKQKVCATVKHYIAYGLSESGINLAPAHIGELDIREYMLPPFRACIKAGAWALMPSYNEVDGVPMHSSYYWMKNVLREELKFDGMIITDYSASNQLRNFHRIVDTPVEAGKILCDNEIDTEGCSFFGYNDEFRKLVKEGKYPVSKVDKCVKNILRLKFRLGLFENPYAQIEKMNYIHNANSVKLAKEVSDKGIVLLKNDGVLPLKKSTKVALIGPNADVSQLGNYIYYGYFDKNYKGKCVADECLTLKDVFEKNNVDFLFEKGSEFERTDDIMLKKAVAVAEQSDVVVLALGDNSRGGSCCGAQDDIKRLGKTKMAVTSGEGFDLSSIELTDAQIRLFDEISKTGKKIIMLVYGGRPHAITDQVDRSNGILFTFGIGEQGSESIYDILFGSVNPSGKLPLSFPRSTGHLPCFYNHKPSARGSNYKAPGSIMNPGMDYVFDSPAPLYPFGYGLSYTQFEYSEINVVKKGRYTFSVEVNVKNVGNYDGDESVLLFLSAKTQRVTPVVKKLRAFERISLKTGESKKVTFTLRKEDFSFVNTDKRYAVAHTQHTVTIADKIAVIDVE